MDDIISLFKDNYKKILFIAIILVTVGLIFSGSILFSLYGNISDLKTTEKELSKKFADLEQYKSAQDDKGPRGPTGPRGPAGSQGNAGGEYQAMGPLRNLQSNGAYVMDRLHGTGTSSIAYLNKLTYQPNQIWTYLSNNQIQNQYGDCLEGDQVGGNVYINGCDPNNTKQKWKYNNYGQISSLDTSSSSNNNECLDVSYESQFDGPNKIISGSTLDKDTNHVNLRRVKLKECNPSNNLSASQQWVFT